MKNWNLTKIGRCIDEAINTYTSLLAEWLPYEKLNIEEQKFRDNLSEREIEFVPLESIARVKRLHNFTYDAGDPDPKQGVIVIVEDEAGNSLVVDGNHRLNTISDTPGQIIPVIFVRDVFVQAD